MEFKVLDNRLRMALNKSNVTNWQNTLDSYLKILKAK